MCSSENIKLLISSLDAPSKWIQEEKINFSKNFDVFELEKKKLIDFTDTYKPIYSIAKLIIGAHILVQGDDEAIKEEKTRMLMEMMYIFNDIKDELQNK